ENDTVATNEIRFGDNDRLSALVAHLVGADALVLLDAPAPDGGSYKSAVLVGAHEAAPCKPFVSPWSCQHAPDGPVRIAIVLQLRESQRCVHELV
ncbi:hypothetical protein ACNJQJ_21975, partial [Mycobacterium tuberculosis]